MKLSKYFLSAFAFVFAIGGALASLSNTFTNVGWATVAGVGVEVFSGTLCQTDMTAQICTAGPADDGDNRPLYQTKQGAEGSIQSQLLYEVIP